MTSKAGCGSGEDALERGDLSIVHAAQRIKELHQQRQEWVRKKESIDHKCCGAEKVLPIPASQIDLYIAEIQRRFSAKANRSRKVNFCERW